MFWTHFCLVVLGSGILMSVADWLFMGVLFHEKYKEYPEVWRDPQGGNERGKILWTTLMGFVIAAVFLYLALRLNFESYEACLKLAAAVWVMGALPLTIGNGLWMKFPKQLVVSHSLGWLVKYVILAVMYKLFL